jgi:starch-binding outer membrane protein, SusD/RagB family
MKQRSIKIVATFFLLTAGVYLACNKKKLDIPPPSQSEAGFFNTEYEFRTAVIGAYASLTDYYSSAGAGFGGDAMLQAWFLPGDDLTSGDEQAFEVFKGINTSNGKLSNFFRSSYIIAGRANKIMAKLETNGSVFTTPGLKNNVQGEMLFLRGFVHYMLWNVFGTAPLDTVDVTSVSQFNPPSSKGTELLDQSIKDFARAATLLPAAWDGGDKGRVTANSAFGMLGKALVFRGTVSKTVPDFQAAIVAFNQITGASLTANFNDNFDYTKENNSESLFEFQAGHDISGGDNAWLGNDACDCGVASSYFQMFYQGDGTYMGGNLYLPTQKLIDAFDAADPRVGVTFNAAKTQIEKYVKVKSGAVSAGAVNSVNNHRVLRYADVILLKAEAILKSGGAPADAIALLNTVRTRARQMVVGGTVPANLSVAETNPTVIMGWIMDERLRELAAEGHRWFDLRRWHLAGTIDLNNAFFSSAQTKINYDEKSDDHYLYFPIPESETSKNPNILQNPGY